MDALDLAPGDYQGTYKLVGGRLSLDFVNTISWPGTERRHDWLDSTDNLRRWLRAVDLIAPSRFLDLDAAIELRAVLDAVLRPLAHAQRPPCRAVERFNEYLAKADARRLIDPSTLAWSWKPPREMVDVLDPAVLDAAELLAAGDHARLRHCPSCDWLFEDQTRNGRRRWCDMADCGSRDKARRYYQRNR